MLSVENLHCSYGRIQALRGVSLKVHRGEIVALLGANGAGKSTLIMSICGRPRPWSGAISYDGRSLLNIPTEDVVRRGIAVVPEGRRIFSRMSVEENLQMGGYLLERAAYSVQRDHVFELFPRLEERARQIAGTLSGGEQQMLAIGRALMCRPSLLLLDEPSLGLAPIVVEQVFDAILRLSRETAISILLVEQNAHQALAVAARGYVLKTGSVALSGSNQELLEGDNLSNAYLQ